MADVLLDWAGDAHGANLAMLEMEIGAFVDRGTTARRWPSSHLGAMLADTTTLLRSTGSHCFLRPGALRSGLHLAGGHGRGLDPSFPWPARRRCRCCASWCARVTSPAR